ncbi:MAG: DUF433 domain-containing protein [Bacteroidota bacterium]
MSKIDHYIEATPGVRSGKPRIAGRRITVADVAVWHERLGMSADEIASAYGLTLSEIYAALAYYYDHRAAIDASLVASDQFAATLRDQTPSKVHRMLKLHG